ncbi:MAG TPA: DUF3828 domain-containing protein [Myxococcales bacterium]|nr:DUF3828 domain-containing protein [Myxococcales bacterium]
MLLALIIAAAAPQTAEQFVQELYGRYSGKDAKGVVLDSPRAVRRWFAPELAKLILADRERAAKNDEAPTLDGDPFVDAQDFEIGDLNVTVKETAQDAAAATVTFTNLGDDVTVLLELVRLKQGWRIRELTARGQKLSALLTPK